VFGHRPKPVFSANSVRMLRRVTVSDQAVMCNASLLLTAITVQVLVLANHAEIVQFVVTERRTEHTHLTEINLEK